MFDCWIQVSLRFCFVREDRMEVEFECFEFEVVVGLYGVRFCTRIHRAEFAFGSGCKLLALDLQLDSESGSEIRNDRIDGKQRRVVRVRVRVMAAEGRVAAVSEGMDYDSRE
jgi:hypothetical protein